MLKMYRESTLLLALMTVYTFPCYDRGNSNVMLLLQSCTDSLQDQPSTSSETFPTPSDTAYGVGNVTVEEDVDVVKESSKAANRRADTGIRQEEIPEEVSYRDIQFEPVDVGCVCFCLLLNTFYMCPFF
jgi:hypothetical protein